MDNCWSRKSLCAARSRRYRFGRVRLYGLPAQGAVGFTRALRTLAAPAMYTAYVQGGVFQFRFSSCQGLQGFVGFGLASTHVRDLAPSCPYFSWGNLSWRRGRTVEMISGRIENDTTPTG